MLIPWSPTCWCWSCWWFTTTWTLEWPRGGKNGSSTTTWWRRDGPHGALQWRVQGNAWRFLVTILANILIFQPRPQWNSILQISDARDINSEPLQKKLLQQSPRKSFLWTVWKYFAGYLIENIQRHPVYSELPRLTVLLGFITLSFLFTQDAGWRCWDQRYQEREC